LSRIFEVAFLDIENMKNLNLDVNALRTMVVGANLGG
jgi:hypothetical protein